MSSNKLTLLPKDIIKINIIGCKDLVAADSNGLSDGYIVINSFIPNGSIDLIGKEKIKTSVKKKNLNPVWNESFSMPALVESVDYVKLKVTVMDYDLLSKDDFLGTAEFIIDNSFGSNTEKVITSKLENIEHGEITVGITIERSTENVEIDKYRNELLSTIPSTRYTIHRGKRYLHFQCPNNFILDKDESQESQRILLRCEAKTLQFYILENGNDYPYNMSKEKVLSIISYVEQHRPNYKMENTEIRIQPSHYFGLSSNIEHLEESKFHNELNGQLRFGQVLIFDQVDLPYCIAAMMLTSDLKENSFKNSVLIDFILNSLQFEEK